MYLGPQIYISERYSPGSLVLMPQAVIETCMELRKGSRSAVLWGLSSHPLLPHTDSALALLQPTISKTLAFHTLSNNAEHCLSRGVSVLCL